MQNEDFSFRGPVGIYFCQTPYINSELFVGRGSELDMIAKALHPSHRPHEQKRVILSGVAGIGKTMLAHTYAKSSHESYNFMFWLNASSETTLKDDFRSIAIKVNATQDLGALEDKQIVKRVHQWLSDPNNSRWLLIFDDYNGHDQFQIDQYFPPASHGAIMVTTRQPDLVAGSVIQIQAFENIEDSLAILQILSKREDVQSDPYAHRVTDLVGGHPLALTHIGGYMQQRNDLTFERFLQVYQDGLQSQEYQEGFQSDKSNPSSIFSLLSIQSTALTTDTQFTADEMYAAIDELVGIFLHDSEMASLYREAIYERRIAPARFVRNFRRLLKRFAVNLKEEAQEAIDLDLANFVLSRAGLVADNIGGKLEKLYSRPDTTSVQSQGVQARDSLRAHHTAELDDVSSDDEVEEELDRELEEKFTALVSHGRSFIKESTALQKLRKELKNFIFPPHSNKRLDTEPVSEVRSWYQGWVNYATSRTLGWEMSHEAPGCMTKEHLNLKGLLSSIGLLEGSVPKGYQRFRWINRHGEQLYDDYVEHEPGAIEALREYLNATTVPNNIPHASNQEQTSFHPASMYTLNPISMSAGILTSIDITDQSTNAPNTVQTDSIQQDIETGNSFTRPLLLLSCIEKRGRPVQLHQEIVTHVTDDRELFHALRRVYFSHRSKFELFWSLRTLHSIHFMKFGYGGHGLVDARCHPELCEHGKPCACIPPTARVFPQSEEYSCQPIPSKLSPPYGPRLMMDFFKDPNSRKPHADSILQQLPKRISTELDLDEAEMMDAWGIFYREDWDWMRIWTVLGVAFFTPSVLFGILWGIMKQDIQGAFGVASWWMTGATIAVGIVGTCI
ncbi:unnamed protein product [Penicillium salamii]|uniref:NB-ARC domain-containing protein n=1 Tax=Penicillium salamii TaxID=1612424 RepID=A0A9W4N3R0_9EURO|nr:unnamed protein product [Penicillium salamii]